MSHERPKRFVATTHRGNGGWVHAVFWILVIVGAAAGGSAVLTPPTETSDQQDKLCEPVVNPDPESARLLIDAGWVDRTGARDTIYPPGCDAHP